MTRKRRLKKSELPRELARTVLRPNVQAATTIARWKPGAYEHEVQLGSLMTELQEQATSVSRGDLARSEAMLSSQAHTLDAIFNELARRASATNNLNLLDAYLRLSLKAQAQCRATLEALAASKSPRPLTFVNQANIANGPQQVVNNGIPSPPSCAQETEIPPNELLQQHEQRMDTRAPQAAVPTDPAMATVGNVHGSANSEG